VGTKPSNANAYQESVEKCIEMIMQIANESNLKIGDCFPRAATAREDESHKKCKKMNITSENEYA
jgi:hypothetical protein